MYPEPDDIALVRNVIKTFMRSLGTIEGKRAFCYRCTYAQCHVIWEIAQSNAITANELAQRLNISKSAVSRTVDELVSKKLLHRKANPADRRSLQLELTSDGLAAYEEIRANSHRYFEAVIAQIPSEQRQTVLASMELFRIALQHVFHSGFHFEKQDKEK